MSAHDKHVSFIAREDAVDRIASHLADCDAFVIGVPPDAMGAVAYALEPFDGFVLYVDNGTGSVLALAGPAAAPLMGLMLSVLPPLMIAVAVVPKTVSAADLGKALGRSDISADGSRDLIILGGSDAPVLWPLFLVEAIERVDPYAAAVLRSADLGRQS